MAAWRSTHAKLRRLRRWFGKNQYDLLFLCTGLSRVQFDWQMAKYDCNTFRNYIAFLHGRMPPGTRRPHHDSELISCYHDAFLTWGHYHNNIMLFNQDSPITRSHFMDPTDRAIKGFYCMYFLQHQWFLSTLPQLMICCQMALSHPLPVNVRLSSVRSCGILPGGNFTAHAQYIYP